MNSKQDAHSILNRSFFVATAIVFFTLGIAYAATPGGNPSASSTQTLDIATQVATSTASTTSSTPTSTSALIDLGGIEDSPSNTSIEGAGDYNDLIFSFSSSTIVTAVSQNGLLSPLTPNLVNTSSTIYWDNLSLDGPEENIGYCVLGNGNCPSIGDPFSDPQYLAGQNGAQVDDILFNTSGSVTITLLAKIAAYNAVDSLGWYDPANPLVMHPIFAGSAATGTTMTFTPTPTFGLYLDNGHGGIFSSQNDQNVGDGDSQHFALFEVGPSLTSISTSTSGSGGSGPGSGPGSSSSTDADIAILKTVDNANPAGGDTVNYTITVTDNGPATSTIVAAQDILPMGLSLVSATTSVGAYDMSTGNWTIGTLSPDATATLLIAATVSPNYDGQTITNTATVTQLSSLVDQNPANNSSSVSIVVQPAPCTSNCGGGGGGGGGGTTTSGGGTPPSVVVGVPDGGGGGGGGSTTGVTASGNTTSAVITSIVPSLPNAGSSPDVIPSFPNTGFPPRGD
jgi:uncharacterized repeat protein (TIGR01451 family)